MSEPNDPNVQVIENATRDDVRPGDHITWERVEEFGGATIYERREGIAYGRDLGGKWFTEAGVCLTDVVPHEAFTVTIRRAVQRMPSEYDGAVLIPADGCRAITTTSGQEFSRLTFTTKQSLWYGPNLAAPLGHYVIQTTSPSHLILGTWKAADQ